MSTLAVKNNTPTRGMREAMAARDAARRMADHPGPYRVSRARPCPICGANKWCLWDPETGVCLCPREASGAVEGLFGVMTLGEYGHLHVVDSGRLPLDATSHRPPRNGDRRRDAATSPSRDLPLPTCLSRDNGPAALDAAADALGVPPTALRALGCVRAGHGVWTPERDARGTVIGWQRRDPDGGKLAHGRRGLVHSPDWRKRAVETGVVYLAEGMTDTAAMAAMGFAAVGRPSCTGGGDLLGDLLAVLPPAVKIIVVADRDRDDAGRVGALDTARQLASRLDRPVEVVLPPADAKDVRAWYVAHTDRDSDPAAMALRWVLGSVDVAVELVEQEAERANVTPPQSNQNVRFGRIRKSMGYGDGDPQDRKSVV